MGGDSFVGLSGDLSYRCRRVWEVSVGSAYAAYSYNRYLDFTYAINGASTALTGDGTVVQETPYSLTYFLRAKWNATRYLVLRAEGAIEDDVAAADLSLWVRASAEVRF